MENFNLCLYTLSDLAYTNSLARLRIALRVSGTRARLPDGLKSSEQSSDIGFRSLTLAVTGTLVVTLTSTITRKFFLPQICL